MVGAGPGDKGLLTLRAAELIRKADVVVYDRLIGKDITDSIPEKTIKIDVGKSSGNHTIAQDKINEILIREAKKGHTVVRLKGGDPYIFGRGAEEAEALIANGINFEIVPGVTSAAAVPAYAGIPLTHRDYCSSVHIITGHARADGDLNMDFDALVRVGGTLVFMMSVASFGKIADGLIKAGMNKDMPCAVIQNGTTFYQRKFIGTVSDMEEIIRVNDVKAPAVIVVGEVCNLSDKLDFFVKRPLFGKKIMVVQSEKRASALSDMLKNFGAHTEVCACVKTKVFEHFDDDVSDYNIIVFTSAAGVSAFFEHRKKRGKDSRSLYNKNFACVGEKTAEKLAEYGIISDFVPRKYDGEHLAREMAETGFISPSDSVLLLRAENASREIIDVLDKYKINYCDRAVYRNEPVTAEKADLTGTDYITFTSKSGVEGFAEIYGGSDFSGITAVCIGEKTAEAAKKIGFNTVTSPETTLKSMAECIIEISGEG